jgi:dTDP-4-amino-4,6-dideoxygalactose transaminase
MPGHEHHLPGGNFRMTEMQGALLGSQMRRLEEQTRRRDENGRFLDVRLGQVEGIQPMERDPEQDLHSYHLYMFRFDAEGFGMPRDRFLHLLRAEGVPAYGGYAIPLHEQPLFRSRPETCPWPCPVAERACASEAVWLGQNVLLAEPGEMDDIAKAIEKISAPRVAHPL